MKKDKRSEAAATDAVAAKKTAVVKSGKPKADKSADKIQSDKMTIYEYEEKYVKRQNTKGATFLLRLIVALVGVFFVWCFFSISKEI